MGKTHSIRKAVGITALTCLAAITCAVITCYVILYWQSRNLMNTVHEIKVGDALDTRAITAAERAGGIAYASTSISATYFYVDPSTLADRQSASQFLVRPLEDCRVDDCTISIPGSRLQVDHLYRFSERYPSTILPIFRWLYGRPSRHRWLPIAWVDPVVVIVKKGVIQELDLQMRSLSVGDQMCPQVEVRITMGSLTDSRWQVMMTENHMSGNSDCGRVRHIRVQATPGAPADKLADAVKINIRCLLPGAYCSECDMLREICRKYLTPGREAIRDMPAALTIDDYQSETPTAIARPNYREAAHIGLVGS